MHTLQIQKYSLCPKETNKQTSKQFLKTMKVNDLYLHVRHNLLGWVCSQLRLYSPGSCTAKQVSFLMVCSHIFMAWLFLSWKCINSDRQCQLQIIFELVWFGLFCFFCTVVREESSPSPSISLDSIQQ